MFYFKLKAYQIFFFFLLISSIKSPASGTILMDTYSSGCGSETQRVANSIKGFKKMVDEISKADKCQTIKENLANKVPKIEDIQKVVQSQSKLRTIKKYENELRDIINSLSATRSPPPTQQEIHALTMKKEKIEMKLEGLKHQLGLDATAQQLASYSSIIDNIDQYSQYIGNAINNGCLKNTGTARQAILSLTGIAGLMLSSTSLGLGLSGAVRLTRNLLNIDKKYNTTGLDKTLMSMGLKCALTTLNQEHCELIKNKILIDQVDTEAKYCDECHLSRSGGFSEVQDMLDILPIETDQNKAAVYFVINWRQRKTGGDKRIQALRHLAGMANNLSSNHSQESMKTGDGEYFVAEDVNKFIEKIKRAGDAYKALEQAKGLSNEQKAPFQETFRNSLNALTAKNEENQNQLEQLVNFIDYRFQDMQEQWEKYITDNSDQVASPQMIEFFKGMNRNMIYKLFNLSSGIDVKNKQEDMISAFNGSRKQLESFSKIFMKDINLTLDYIENEMDVSKKDRLTAKSAMCLKTLGLVSLPKDISKRCDDAKIRHQGQEFAFKVFKKFPHEVRVCAVQDFYKCAESQDEASPACLAHNKRKSRFSGVAN